ncbi:hypothetical protein L1887_34132 [Cichorium endivia]|nr:hypothetical protein L1887_34132 [Cichorium endivia]
MIKDLGSLLRGKKKVEWIDVLHILESRIPSEASSSTSTIHKSFKYDVFLSFCGQDTGMTFIDHLYDALVHQGIHTYKDDQRIKQGTNIGNEHIRSIQESKFFIIIFTKNYASSSWCLDELVKIMECHRTTAHTAYPVFYHDLEPSEVHSQVGVDGENDDNWRQALEEAVNLAGWNMRDTADGEAGFIEKIEIKNILANRQGTEAIRHIQLSELQLSPDIVLEGLGSMEELRCLILNSEADDDDFSCGWEFDEARKYLPNSLQVLRWAHYPVPSLPVTFQANNLVTLEMPDSRITQLWEGIERQALNNLRFLDLSRSIF